MSLPGNARNPIVNSHSSESRRTPKFRNEFSIRESVFPVHSLIGPCSDWSRRLSFSPQSTVRHVVIPERLGSNMQYSLYFSLLAGNWGAEKSSHETASTAILRLGYGWHAIQRPNQGCRATESRCSTKGGARDVVRLYSQEFQRRKVLCRLDRRFKASVPRAQGWSVRLNHASETSRFGSLYSRSERIGCARP
jgi:hypothetical protein